MPAAPTLSAQAALGEKIFNDVSLSVSGQQSCATCHDPAHHFTDNDMHDLQVERFYAGIPGLWASIHLAGGFAAVAGVRATLDHFVSQHPQFRVLADPVLAIHQTIAMRHGHDQAAATIDDIIRRYEPTTCHTK
mgnify:CR=1 FL=1